MLEEDDEQCKQSLIIHKRVDTGWTDILSCTRRPRPDREQWTEHNLNIWGNEDI